MLLCGRPLRLNSLQTNRTQADDPSKHLWLSVFGVRIEAGNAAKLKTMNAFIVENIPIISVDDNLDL